MIFDTAGILDYFWKNGKIIERGLSVFLGS